MPLHVQRHKTNSAFTSDSAYSTDSTGFVTVATFDAWESRCRSWRASSSRETTTTRYGTNTTNTNGVVTMLRLRDCSMDVMPDT